MDESHPPGEILRQTLNNLGLSQADVARRLNLSANKIWCVLAGYHRISPEFAIALEKAQVGTAEEWTVLQANYDLFEARKRLAG